MLATKLEQQLQPGLRSPIVQWAWSPDLKYDTIACVTMCVAGGIVSAREMKSWRRSRQESGEAAKRMGRDQNFISRAPYRQLRRLTILKYCPPITISVYFLACWDEYIFSKIFKLNRQAALRGHLLGEVEVYFV